METLGLLSIVGTSLAIAWAWAWLILRIAAGVHAGAAGPVPRGDVPMRVSARRAALAGLTRRTMPARLRLRQRCG